MPGSPPSEKPFPRWDPTLFCKPKTEEVAGSATARTSGGAVSKGAGAKGVIRAMAGSDPKSHAEPKPIQQSDADSNSKRLGSVLEGDTKGPGSAPAGGKPAQSNSLRRDLSSLAASTGWRHGINKVQAQRSIDIISPPPRLTPSQWAELYAFLPTEENAEPGKFHVSRRPHEAAMLNDPIDPRVREIFWMGASQAMGKTVCLVILLMYVIHQRHKSAVMVRPDLDAGLNWKRDKLLPTIRDTPCMAGLLVDPRKRDGNSTSMNQRYPGGSLRIIGANSPSGFRSSSSPVVFQDEIDAYEVNKEGDPCALADRAAKTFSDKWLIKTSTTTLEGMSRIHAGYMRGDQQKYFLPCPICGAFQHLLTEQMKFSFTPEERARFDDEKKSFKTTVNSHTWEIGAFTVIDTPRTIYVCEHCHHGWTDDQRIAAYLSGHTDNPAVVVNGVELRSEWRATAVDDNGKPKKWNGIRSRAINGMYWATGLAKEYVSYLHQFAEEFLAAKRGGRATLQAWTNIFKNEPFADVSEKMEWQPLKDRAEDIGPDLEPQVMEVYGLCDVQREPPRVEILWMGFGILQEVWLLDWEVMSGDLDMPDMQENLGAHISGKRFNHPYLGEMKPQAFGIDLGYATKAVKTFCKANRTGNVFGVKGFAGTNIDWIWQPHYDKRYHTREFFFNVDHFKSVVFDRLRLTEPGPRYIHIPKETVTYVGKDGVKRTFRTNFTTAFYVELCSERKFQKRNKDGTLSYRWEKVSASARNEPLDLMDYGFGLYETQKPDARIARKWERVKQIMREREEQRLRDGGAKQPEQKANVQVKPTPESPPAPASFPTQGAKVQPQVQRHPEFKKLPPRRPVVRRPAAPWASKAFHNPFNL